jgi:hypothetical protein
VSYVTVSPVKRMKNCGFMLKLQCMREVTVHKPLLSVGGPTCVSLCMATRGFKSQLGKQFCDSDLFSNLNVHCHCGPGFKSCL